MINHYSLNQNMPQNTRIALFILNKKNTSGVIKVKYSKMIVTLSYSHNVYKNKQSKTVDI